MELCKIVGVERKAELGKVMELRGIIRVVGGEHACSCGGGLRKRRALVEYGDACATAMEFEGKREADDAGSGDADVGAVHRTSLVGGN